MLLRLSALLGAILVLGALTVLALQESGFIGIFAGQFASYAGLQVLTDLVIVCVLAIIWMIRDARTSGVTPWPYVLITLIAGGFGPLLYLVARELKARGR